MNGTLFCSVISFRVLHVVPDPGIYGRHPVSFPTLIVLQFSPLLSRLILVSDTPPALASRIPSLRVATHST